MGFAFADMVQTTSATAGTDDYVIAADAIGAFVSVEDGIGDGNWSYFSAIGSNGYEIFKGTLGIAGAVHTLSRDTVYAGSNGTSKVAWTGGTRVIQCVSPAVVLGMLYDPTRTGFVAQTDATTMVGRTITGGSVIGVTNGNGASGNPTLDDSALGALAQKDTVNNADWSGADLAVANGGSGASTGAAALDNFGLELVSEAEAQAGTATTARRWTAQRVAQAIAALSPASTHAVFQHAVANNTDGGGSTSGAWEKRTLATTQVNGISGVSLSSSVVTLPAGTYRFSWWAVAYNTTRFQTRLANTTADPDEYVYGAVVYPGRDSGNGQQAADVSTGDAVLTFGVETTVELQQRVAESTATNGYGVPASFGGTEVYAALAIEKMA